MKKYRTTAKATKRLFHKSLCYISSAFTCMPFALAQTRDQSCCTLLWKLLTQRHS